MAEVGTFKCGRQDCEKTPGQPCPRCGMPDLSVAHAEILNLYNRVVSFKALPYPGGILQQPAWVMECLDVCQEATSAVAEKKSEEARTASMKSSMEKSLG